MSNQTLKQAVRKGSKISVLGVQNMTQQKPKQPGLTFEASPTLSTRLKWMPFRGSFTPTFFFFFANVSMKTCNGNFTRAILKAPEPLCFIQAECFNVYCINTQIV